MRQIVVGTFDQQDAARAAILALANDRFDPRRVLIGGAACTIPAGFLLAPCFGSGSLGAISISVPSAL